MNTLLDDHIVLTQQFSFSPHKGAFEERITAWERKLRLTQEVTTEWLGCQRNWMYLQPIFDSDDINRQLPAEGKRFSGVDRLWRKTIERVRKAPHMMRFCDDEELLEQWIKANSELERVQKNLADYLETKRAAFARFYFLSNDELISILSQTKDPNAVQPHLRKCFEAIHGIKMEGPECEMTSMMSPEKEYVRFISPLYPKVWSTSLPPAAETSRPPSAHPLSKSYSLPFSTSRHRAEPVSQSLPNTSYMSFLC